MEAEVLVLISIVIPTLYPKQNLRRLLESIVALDYPLKEIEVLIVGNRKQDEAFLNKIKKKYLNIFYDFSIFITQVRSANIARNMGIRRARGEYIFFIDDDCIIHNPQYIKRMTSFLESHADVDAVGGHYLLDESYSQRAIDKTYARLAQQWLEQAADPETGNTQYLIGGNCCYRAKLFREGFVFDPSMSFGGTETSLNSLLISRNKKLVFLFDNPLIHRFRISLFNFLKKAYLQGQGKAHNIRNNNLIVLPSKKSINKDFKNIYTSAYDYFFHLGFHSLERSSALSLKDRLMQKFEMFLFPPRVQTIARRIYSQLFHMIYMISNRFYYQVVYRIYCKIYYMSEYHWRVYLRPVFDFILKIVGKKK